MLVKLPFDSLFNIGQRRVKIIAGYSYSLVRLDVIDHVAHLARLDVASEAA